MGQLLLWTWCSCTCSRQCSQESPSTRWGSPHEGTQESLKVITNTMAIFSECPVLGWSLALASDCAKMAARLTAPSARDPTPRLPHVAPTAASQWPSQLPPHGSLSASFLLRPHQAPATPHPRLPTGPGAPCSSALPNGISFPWEVHADHLPAPHSHPSTGHSLGFLVPWLLAIWALHTTSHVPARGQVFAECGDDTADGQDCPKGAPVLTWMPA